MYRYVWPVMGDRVVFHAGGKGKRGEERKRKKNKKKSERIVGLASCKIRQ
jgi:hypothetical protein